MSLILENDRHFKFSTYIYIQSVIIQYLTQCKHLLFNNNLNAKIFLSKITTIISKHSVITLQIYRYTNSTYSRYSNHSITNQKEKEEGHLPFESAGRNHGDLATTCPLRVVVEAGRVDRFRKSKSHDEFMCISSLSGDCSLAPVSRQNIPLWKMEHLSIYTFMQI